MPIYLKTVSISGFKSYQSTAEYEPFFQGHNVVVGRNGSGKSNFFGAIKFVLGLGHLSATDRTSMLRDVGQSGQAVVCLTFVNDNALPDYGPEFQITRTISASRDSMQINGASASVEAVRDLLDSAGFPVASNYNIVEQGTVIKFAGMAPPARLELLHSVSGASAYDRRRAETVKILEGAAERRQMAESSIAEADSRIAALGGEKRDYEAYSALDRRRRAAEHSLLTRDRESVRKDLGAAEHELAPLNTHISDARTALKDAEARVHDITRRSAIIGAELDSAQVAATAAASSLAFAQSESKQAGENYERVKQRASTAQTAAAKRRERLPALQEELSAVAANIERLTAERSSLVDQVAGLVSEVGVRATAAEAVAEPVPADEAEWRATLEKKIADARAGEQAARDTASASAALAEQAEAAAAAVIDGGAAEDDSVPSGTPEAVAAADNALKEARIRMRKMNIRSNGARNELVDATSQSKKAATDLDARTQQVAAARNDMFSKTVPAITAGIQLAFKTVSESGGRGVKGTVIECLGEVDPTFHAAVEAVAGNQLYHLITEDDTVARRLLSAMKSGAQSTVPAPPVSATARGNNRGRAAPQPRFSVTFKPLAQLDAPEITIPEDSPHAGQATPLMACFPHSRPDARAAIAAVFGRAFIVPDITIGAAIAAAHDVDCVTIHGDLIGRHGEITGGFDESHNTRRLAAAGIYRQARQNEAAARHSVTRAAKGVEEKSEILAEAMTALKEATAEEAAAAAALQDARDKLQIANEAREATARAAADARRRAEDSANDHRELSARLTALERQLEAGHAQARSAALSAAAAQAAHDTARRALTEGREALAAVQRAVDVAGQQRARLRNERAQLATESAGPMTGALALTSTIDFDAAEEDMATAAAAVAAAEAASEQAAAAFADLSAQARSLAAEQAAAEQAERQAQDALDEAERAAVELRATVAAHATRDSQLLDELRELNYQFMDDAIDMEMTGLTTAAIHDELRRIQGELRRFDTRGINHRAVEELANLEKSRESLNERLAEVTAGHTAIESMITELDGQRDAALNEAFDALSGHFTRFFAELSMGGRAELVLVPPAEIDEGAAEPAELTPASAAGLDVRAAFDNGPTVDTTTLSGGQRTLVALALIFALQSTDPAPVTLLDEVDSALDERYRTALANVVAGLAATGMQILSVSFRPELVRAGGAWYIVTQRHRASQIRAASLEDALATLAADEVPAAIAPEQ